MADKMTTNTRAGMSEDLLQDEAIITLGRLGWRADELQKVIYKLRHRELPSHPAVHTKEAKRGRKQREREAVHKARCVRGGPFDYRTVPLGQGQGWSARIERLEAFMLAQASKPDSGYDNMRQVLSLNVDAGLRNVLERVVTNSK